VASGKLGKIHHYRGTYLQDWPVDPEGDPLRFTMDLNGDGQLNVGGSTGASCREPWTYSAGTWNPEICVTDLGPQGQTLHRYQCRTYTIVAS